MWCLSQANHREAAHAKLRQMFDEIVSTLDNTYKTFREDGREVCMWFLSVFYRMKMIVMMVVVVMVVRYSPL